MPETDPYLIRASEISDFRYCPLYHKLKWLDLWHKDESTSLSSTVGTAWHQVIGGHYQTIRDAQRDLGRRKLTNAWQQRVLDTADALIENAVHPDLQEQLSWMYDGHLEKYGYNEAWEILYVEETLAVPFREKDGSQSRYQYRWTSDLVIRDCSTRAKSVYGIDHKSTAQKLRQNDIDLMDSIAMYVWAWRQMGLKVLAPAIMQAQTKQLKRAQTLEERFSWLPSFRTDIELENIQSEFLKIAKIMRGKENVEDGPYSSPDPRTCDWKCEFKEAHLVLRKSRNPDKVLPSLMHSRGFTQREAVPSGNVPTIPS